MRRRALGVLPVLVALSLSAGSAQANVVDMNALTALGTTAAPVPYNASDRGGYYGVALLPGTCGDMLSPTGQNPGNGCSQLASLGIPTVSSTGSCADPWLTSDLFLQSTGLCFHGGSVMHGNETFALTWDPLRRYWAGTRGYVEQFLRNVAAGSGTLSSPYALTPQYRDSSGRAGNRSLYGGGCIDYGNPNNTTNANTTCRFGSTVQTGPGNNYPGNGCSPKGNSFTAGTTTANDRCLTDAQLRVEVRNVADQMGMLARVHSGYAPLVTLLLPAGVEACLDASNRLCSANGGLTPVPSKLSTSSTGGSLPAGTYRVEVTYMTANGESLASVPKTVKTTGSTSTLTIPSPPNITNIPGVTVTGWYAYVTGPDGTGFSRQQTTASTIGDALTISTTPGSGSQPPVQPFFCSYHSQVDVHGIEVPYVVQPWTAMTQCDEPDVPQLPANPPPDVLSENVGMRLVSPLSQSQLPSIVDPAFNGWFALDGAEINDNGAGLNGSSPQPSDNGGCVPLTDGLDKVSVSGTSYFLQREFNNAGAMESDPNTYFGCAPNVFLIPSFVVPGSVNPGDDVVFDGSSTASTLIVPNAGYHWSFGDGSTAVGPSVSHAYSKAGTYTVKLTVQDRGGNIRTLSQTIDVLNGNGQPVGGTGGSGTPPPTHQRLHVRLQLLPQSLHSVLRHGLEVQVRSNEQADGFATLSVPRAAAHQVGLARLGAGTVVIGRGTVSGIKAGTVTLHVRLSPAVAKKLSRLRHVALTLRLTLVAPRGQHLTIDAAGRY